MRALFRHAAARNFSRIGDRANATHALQAKQKGEHTGNGHTSRAREKFVMQIQHPTGERCCRYPWAGANLGAVLIDAGDARFAFAVPNEISATSAHCGSRRKIQ